MITQVDNEIPQRSPEDNKITASSKQTPPACVGIVSAKKNDQPQEKKVQEKKGVTRKIFNEASMLVKEKERLFSRGVDMVNRCSVYEPDLNEFSSVSFSDFIRRTALGVPCEEIGRGDFRDSTSNPVSASASASPSVTARANQEPINNKASPCRFAPNAIKKTGCSDEPIDLLSESEDEYEVICIDPSPSPSLSPPKVVSNVEEVPSTVKRKFIYTSSQPDPRKLSEGIAKIIPPSGWWDKSPFSSDITARGPSWQSGSPLGDFLIPSPIQQCASGIGGVYEFSMLELPSQTFAEFRTDADAYRKRQTRSCFDEDTSDDFMETLARKFWKRLGPTMESAKYGADMDGTLFQPKDDACGWNIGRLESHIQLLRADAIDGEGLPGVTSPYLYVGMWGSVFAAHTEDMNLCSINHLHAGAPKYWYSISPLDSKRFESLAVSHFGSINSVCKEFLRHKRYLLSPGIIRKAGIRYTTQIQRAGETIVTFPGSYHFGFNTGFNIAESTNFAVPEWIPHGFNAEVCMCIPDSVRIDMSRFQELVEQYDEEVKDKYPDWEFIKWAEWKAREKSCNADLEDTTPHEYIPIPDKCGRVVEVCETAPRRGLSGTKTPSPKRRNPKAKKLYCLALRVRPDVFIRNTQVLCHLDCVDDQDGKQFFIGTITGVLEEHVRIHYKGMMKKEDIWMRRDSEYLYLDGGPSDGLEGTIEKTKKKRKVKAKSK